MSPSFSSLPRALILLALRVPRTFSSQQERQRRRLLSYGALHAARWEEGRREGDNDSSRAAGESPSRSSPLSSCSHFYPLYAIMAGGGGSARKMNSESAVDRGERDR